MLDHYYTPRDRDPPPTQDLMSVNVGRDSKPQLFAPRTVVDLTSLSLDQIPFAFDCDSDEDDEDSGSDDGYVSTLLRLQRSLPLVVGPRKIAGARRVARAVSSPAVATTATTHSMEVETTPEGEMFHSITAIPGLQTTSFEELRLETYMQSLIATGSARPQPAYTPAVVIPPAFSPHFCDWDKEATTQDVEMDRAASASAPASSSSTSTTLATAGTRQVGAPSVFRSASYPATAGDVSWA
ncbi:hypothetical protein HMN09_01396700 [Mycena chlorophos]|uniref:Uncharacterized protein n=1 Tax=Mycena chlorophos TaxID=658473 RepID=A0A8H6RV70_MYCCL|nr:hypothetical protein HMN09_01396700 [Mycena chlorophos]